MPHLRPLHLRPHHPAARLAARVAALALGALAVLVVAAGPAAADPAGPSDFRSEVTGVEPAVDGVAARIRGGDSFLELEVAAGVEVVVHGYQDEPYLRFLPDGTVERNRLSAATYLNEDRAGAVTVPADVTAAMEDPDTEPEWEAVADGGTYAWHDHRVHWMSKASPPVARGEQVGGAYDPWRVPITVDGQPAAVEGVLFYEEAVSPIPWLVLAVVVAAGLAVGARRVGGVRAASGVLAAVAVLGAVTGRDEWAASPDGSGNPLLWALPVVAVVAASVAVALGERAAGVIGALAAVAALSGWAIFRFQSLLKPVLPGDLPPGLDRASLGLALGASVAVAVVALTSGALALPALADDDGDGDEDDEDAAGRP